MLCAARAWFLDPIARPPETPQYRVHTPQIDPQPLDRSLHPCASPCAQAELEHETKRIAIQLQQQLQHLTSQEVAVAQSAHRGSGLEGAEEPVPAPAAVLDQSMAQQDAQSEATSRLLNATNGHHHPASAPPSAREVGELSPWAQWTERERGRQAAQTGGAPSGGPPLRRPRSVPRGSSQGQTRSASARSSPRRGNPSRGQAPVRVALPAQHDLQSRALRAHLAPAPPTARMRARSAPPRVSRSSAGVRAGPSALSRGDGRGGGPERRGGGPSGPPSLSRSQIRTGINRAVARVERALRKEVRGGGHVDGWERGDPPKKPPWRGDPPQKSSHANDSMLDASLTPPHPPPPTMPSARSGSRAQSHAAAAAFRHLHPLPSRPAAASEAA